MQKYKINISKELGTPVMENNKDCPNILELLAGKTTAEKVSTLRRLAETATELAKHEESLGEEGDKETIDTLNAISIVAENLAEVYQRNMN